MTLSELALAQLLDAATCRSWRVAFDRDPVRALTHIRVWSGGEGHARTFSDEVMARLSMRDIASRFPLDDMRGRAFVEAKKRFKWPWTLADYGYARVTLADPADNTNPYTTTGSTSTTDVFAIPQPLYGMNTSDYVSVSTRDDYYTTGTIEFPVVAPVDCPHTPRCESDWLCEVTKRAFAGAPARPWQQESAPEPGRRRRIVPVED